MTLKWSACLRLQIALILLTAIRSEAQLLTAPPAPTPGSTANSLMIAGNVAIDRLTLNVNFFPGNGVGVTINAGSATLTNNHKPGEFPRGKRNSGEWSGARRLIRDRLRGRRR
jgi:hypothetical protein